MESLQGVPKAMNHLDFDDLGDYGMSGRVMDSLLRSLEDPVLFEMDYGCSCTERSGSMDTFSMLQDGVSRSHSRLPPHHAVIPAELDQAERFNNAAAPTLKLTGIDGQVQERFPPPTPASTDDEEDGLTMRTAQSDTQVTYFPSPADFCGDGANT